MGWRDHLQTDDERVVMPWIGGRKVFSGYREFLIENRLPPEHGWYEFKVLVRKATLVGPADPETSDLCRPVTGYLVGDRIVADDARIDPDPSKVRNFSEKVHLIEPGLDRFARAKAARSYARGPLFYVEMEMPLGPEDEVLDAFVNRNQSVRKISGVTPALEAAFRLEVFQRAETERRRAELEELRRKEELRRRMQEQLGDAALIRELARTDFGAAAKAALLIGSAEYLDHRNSTQRGEKVVRFRLEGRAFECACETETLAITDSGICLTDHDTGEEGDRLLTLESLPSVIREAISTGRLHVYRHVGAY